MTLDRDLERLLGRWLADGPIEAHDRVVEDVASRIGQQRQLPAWRISWKESHVAKYFKPVAGIAAAVVLAVAGISYVSRPSGSDVGGPEASMSPSLSASPSATVARVPQWWEAEGGCVPPNCSGLLARGNHPSQNFEPGFTYTVPDGWVNHIDYPETAQGPSMFMLAPDTPANEIEYAISTDLAASILIATDGRADNDDMGVCRGTVQDAAGTTASEIANTLAASPNLVTSEPSSVSIGGLSGQQIDVQLDPGWTGTCPLDSTDPPTKDFKDIRYRWIVLDTAGGGNVVIQIASLHSADHAAFLDEAMPIVESIEFDINP